MTTMIFEWPFSAVFLIVVATASIILGYVVSYLVGLADSPQDKKTQQSDENSQEGK